MDESGLPPVKCPNISPKTDRTKDRISISAVFAHQEFCDEELQTEAFEGS